MLAAKEHVYEKQGPLSSRTGDLKSNKYKKRSLKHVHVHAHPPYKLNAKNQEAYIKIAKQLWDNGRPIL
uniref:Uncharacterized protein n=1 Tax=Parascaris equorum TaxID=6256 RepID=A0A914RYD4_PAREQ